MILPSGTFIYRGSHAEASNAEHYIGQAPGYLRGDLPVYFAEDPEDVETYGTAVKFKTVRNLNLVNMGDPDIVTELIRSARSKELKHSLEKAFRISNGMIRRVSKIKYDIHVAVYICRLGYDGYWAPRLMSKGEGTFHPEIVLCRPRDDLRVVRVENIRSPPPTRPRVGVNNSIRAAVARMQYQ